MDLLSILPDFPVGPYEHILPLLERYHISTTDLLTLDTIEIAKRTRVPLTDARRFTEHVIRALHQDVGFMQGPGDRNKGPEDDDSTDIASASAADPNKPTAFGKLDVSEWSSISTLDPALNDVLRGGIPTKYVTEITGESATGKSQFLLHLLLSVQLPPPAGLSRRALYISTESALPTHRLEQLLKTHPAFVDIPSDITPPSLDNVVSLNAIDLETQDHVINYQLPVAVSSYDIGLVVIDSVTWNYRGEYSLDSEGMAARAGELVNLGRILRDLAVKEDLAVVVANQVLDRFEDGTDDFYVDQLIHLPPGHGSSSKSPRLNEREENTPIPSHASPTLLQSTNPSTPPLPSEPPSSALSSHPLPSCTRPHSLSLSHQQRFFTGWGDKPPDCALRIEDIAGGLKTPALGLLWSSQIACRIVLKKRSPLIPAPVAGMAVQQSVPDSLPSKQSSTSIDAPTSRQGGEANEREHNASLTSALPPQDGNGISQEIPKDRYPDTRSEDDEYEPSNQPTVRTMKVVFAPWTSGRREKESSRKMHGDPEQDREVEFEIWGGGIRGLE